MTETPKNSGRTLYLVDSVGGALSLLAAGVARSLGVNAVAATSSPMPAAEVPTEVAAVLEEVGMRLPDGGAAQLDALDARDAAGSEIVFLGAAPPPALAGKPVWSVSLYEGTGELERLATARIARDQIERRLWSDSSSD